MSFEEIGSTRIRSVRTGLKQFGVIIVMQMKFQNGIPRDKKADIMIRIKQNYLVSLLSCLLLFFSFAVPVAACPPDPPDPPPPPPVAVLKVDPEEVIVNNDVTFDGSDSYPDIVEYRFDVNNDGTYDYNETPPGDDGIVTHAYEEVGTYTAKLWVKRSNGETDTATCTVTVRYFTVPGDANTIQEAIDAADDDWVIMVEPGRYVENLCFTDKEITLTSTEPNDPAVVARTIIDGNDANNVIIFDSGDANSTITGFTITNGWAKTSIGAHSNNGGGIYCNGVSPTIDNCIITKNEAYDYGGGVYYINCPNPKIINCTIAENKSDNGGGIFNYSATPEITNCIFTGNKAEYHYGGGMYNYYSSPEIINCVFTENICTNWSGGGMWNRYSAPTVTNCTFSANSAHLGYGGGMANGVGGEPNLTNCIFWGNTGGLGTTEQQQIYYGTENVSFCCIEGWTGGGTNNISSDPCFVNPCDPDGPDGIWATSDDGLMLAVGESPCIDEGNNIAVNDVPYDIVGYDRIVDGDHIGDPNVDMGPYEVPTIWFVDVNNADPNDGTSWEESYKYLQDALADSNIGDGNEIWVADGTYRPTDSNDRTISFALKEGVRVYGGFDGNEVGLCQRQWNKYPTILSGDINEPNDANDNSFHVVVSADRAILDGFTITGGNADGSYPDNIGAGIYCDSVSFMLGNCAIVDNNSTNLGGGIYCEDSSVTVRNCVFADNTSGAFGGAALLMNTSDEKLTSVFSNCVFSKNEAQPAGGGICFFISDPGFAEVTNCTFYDNKALLTDGFGGGICNFEWNVTATNCIFWDNEADDSNEIYTHSSAVTTIRCCDIKDSYIDGNDVKDDYTDEILGINAGGNIDDDPNFFDPCDADGADDIFCTTDDGLMLDSNTSPCANAADLYATPLADITGRSWPPADIGAYRRHSNIVVMCWVNESDPYNNPGTYGEDLTKYCRLIATLDVVRSGCLVPNTTIDPVLPEGYSPPSEISIETCGLWPTKAELIVDFGNICDGVIPDRVILLADRSGSLGGFYGSPGLGQGYVDFKEWLEDWLEDHGLDSDDDKVLREKEFGGQGDSYFSERWIAAITREIKSVLGLE